jgi:uncharacterized protein (TIGR04222 family)
MNSLLHNPVTELALPYFLLLYVAVGLIGLIAGGAWIWLCDGTRDDDLPDNPPTLPDPYETAFLRGGAAQVTRLVVFDLIERGYVELSAPKRRFSLFAPAKRLRRSATAPDSAGLTAIQQAAWNWLAEPRWPAQVLHRHIGLVNQIRPLCRIFVKPLEERRLLETGGRRMARNSVSRVMSFGLVVLGAYRLVATTLMGQGDSLGLLPLMAAGLVCTAIICRPQRLSDLGQRFLEYLQLEFGDWDRASLMAEPASLTPADTAESAADRLLRMALFGSVGARHRTEFLCESV